MWFVCENENVYHEHDIIGYKRVSLNCIFSILDLEMPIVNNNRIGYEMVSHDPIFQTENLKCPQFSF